MAEASKDASLPRQKEGGRGSLARITEVAANLSYNSCGTFTLRCTAESVSLPSPANPRRAPRPRTDAKGNESQVRAARRWLGEERPNPSHGDINAVPFLHR